MAEGDPNCIFCKIIAGEIPARELFRDDDILAIEDVNPQAPSHVLVMPQAHVANMSTFSDTASAEKVARLLSKAAEIGRQRGAKGFRLVINEGSDGGQTVEHLHVHVLAGRHMRWPPG
ncbi:MAG: histidine triad nucleotide-binding protein [Candidatus Eremiobacteraeota bacterium]|nr:histidine triad nucleotide-binding protein [Candidatus Eremiobacteraeota bacterium]